MLVENLGSQDNELMTLTTAIIRYGPATRSTYWCYLNLCVISAQSHYVIVLHALLYLLRY